MKKVSKMLAVILSIIFVIQLCAVTDKELPVRTIDLDEIRISQELLDEFEDAKMEYDECSVKFTGKSDCDESYSKVFDNLAMEDGKIEEDEVEYECTFDLDTLQYHLVMNLVDEDGNQIDTEELYTDAFVTEDGLLDAIVEIDGERYQLSDYEEDTVDDCFWGLLVIAVIKIVKVYVKVAETAEQVKARTNYAYNKKLDNTTKGVNKNNYIYFQEETNKNNYNAGNYKFGFTYFGGVGCEVAAVYNARIKIGKPENLSETIYKFEKWRIEIASGFGHLGSDPLEISTYLIKENIRYTKYLTYSSFNNALAKKSNAVVIMSRWNEKKSTGLHTFFVNKNTQTLFYGYNFEPKTKDRDFNYKTERTKISDFNNGSGFIVGYIIG